MLAYLSYLNPARKKDKGLPPGGLFNEITSSVTFKSITNMLDTTSPYHCSPLAHIRPGLLPAYPHPIQGKYDTTQATLVLG